MDGVIVTQLNKIFNPKGDILKIIKKSDPVYDGFGEAYFSIINQDEIKGWKKHKRMTLNLVVPIGEVEFLIYNKNINEFFNIRISKENYKRLTIKSGLWVAFKGIARFNVLFNLSNIEHDPNEATNLDLGEIKHTWS